MRKRPFTGRNLPYRPVAICFPTRLEQALFSDKDRLLLTEICRALATYYDRGNAQVVLSGWRRLPPPVRVEAVGTPLHVIVP